MLFSVFTFQFEEEFIEKKEDLEKLRNGESVNCPLNVSSHQENKRSASSDFY